MVYLVASSVKEIKETSVSFTLGQLVFLLGAFLTVSAVCGIIAKIVRWVRSPELQQNEEIHLIKEHQREQDERMDSFDEYFRRDKREIESIKEGNKVVQQGILALMNHAINGNDIDKLEESRDNLQRYLIER